MCVLSERWTPQQFLLTHDDEFASSQQNYVCTFLTHTETGRCELIIQVTMAKQFPRPRQGADRSRKSAIRHISRSHQ